MVASAGSHEKRRSRPEFFKQGLSHSYMTGSAQLECLVHAQPTVMTLPDVKSQQTRSSAIELQPQSHVAPIMPLKQAQSVLACWQGKEQHKTRIAAVVLEAPK